MSAHTFVQLRCDACAVSYPSGHDDAPYVRDGAIFTITMLRTDARHDGWSRPGGQKDLCLRCTKKRAATKKGKPK